MSGFGTGAKFKDDKLNRLRKKVLHFVILSEAKNPSSMLSVSKETKRDSSLRSE